MAHSSFAGLDDRSLLEHFLCDRDADVQEARRLAQLAWTVLCAREIERMRAYVVLFRRRNSAAPPAPGFDEAVLRTAVERLLAAGPAFEGRGLRDFRTLVRQVAREACADALAGDGG